jgi:hypothetical protein
MTNQKGFTLIEALVSGVVSLVIPATLIAILTASNRQMGDGASRMRLSQIAGVVSEDIHRAGLSATWVYGSAQTQNDPPDCPEGVESSGDEGGFTFCDAKYKVIKAYRIQETLDDRAILKDYTPGKGWNPMVFAGDSVKISLDWENYRNDLHYREPGLFGIGDQGGGGAWAWFNFHFDMEVGGKRVSVPMQMQSVICRNAPSRMNAW